MCDFSLHAVRSRPAEVGDKLTTCLFNTGTGGFRAPRMKGWQFACFPGLSCPSRMKLSDHRRGRGPKGSSAAKPQSSDRSTRPHPHTHHDALEFPEWADCSSDIPRRRAAGHRPSMLYAE